MQLEFAYLVVTIFDFTAYVPNVECDFSGAYYKESLP